MKFKGIIILLVFFNWSFNSRAQVKLPLTGTFKVQALNKNEVRDFDKLVITEDGYTLFNSEKSLRTYKVIAKNSEGYLVEQYFEGNEKKDKPKFTVLLDKKENDVFYITFFRGSRVEKMQLIKIK